MIKLGETYKDKSGNDVRIICVDKRGEFPIVGIVSINPRGKEEVMSYTSEGSYLVYEGSPHDLILPEDYSTYKVDEPVMVRDHDEGEWKRRYFAGVRGGKPCVFCGGATSWSVGSPDHMLVWNQCRRPTKEELGENQKAKSFMGNLRKGFSIGRFMWKTT